MAVSEAQKKASKKYVKLDKNAGFRNTNTY